jgi:aryl-alcohol dehydrogenase-like predicted oxidoreductase
MDYRTLGRTGLRVSVMGWGAGGPSRLGQRDEVNSEADSVALVQRGLDAGINFIDTAEAYRTEEIVGQAIAGRDRSSLVISTKKSSRDDGFQPDNLRQGLEDSLRKLGTDYIDVYHLHGLKAEQYDYCLNETYPALVKLREAGKIRFIGVTEGWNSDLDHAMLKRAVADDVWDVLMVGFNFLNQTAREPVLVPALEKDLGILIMFAVRRALSRPEKLGETLASLVESGEIDPADIDLADPLAFIATSAASLPDAGYRFCREEPGTHVILSGTGSMAHLEDNIESFGRPPLPPEIIQRLQHIFRNVHSVTGE